MPLTFKGFAQLSALTALPTGSIVTFDQEGQIRLGIILDYDKPKYTVLSLQGDKLFLISERLHKIPADPQFEQLKDEAARLGFLKTLLENAELQSKSVDLEKLWTLCTQKELEVNNSRLCELYFGEDQTLKHLAIRLAIAADRLYFKRKKDLFVPRNFENIEEIRKLEAEKARKLELRDFTLESFKKKMADSASLLSEECLQNVWLLEDLAVDAPNLDNQIKREGKELVNFLSEGLKIAVHGSIPERAYSILESINHFNARTNVPVLRYRPSLDYPQQVLDEAKALKIPGSISESAAEDKRIDLTHLECVAIDDASTRDMDDAVSLEQNQDGYSLGIHISDVSSAIKEGSRLDLEALSRGTSLYLTDLTINMFPPEISENKLSLKSGQVRAALSFIFQVNPRYEITETKIVPSLIRVSKQLSYPEVDALLEGKDHKFNVLYNITSELEASRVKNGGFKVNKRDAAVAIEADGKLKLVEIDENAPGRSLIAELMVLANTAFAQYASEHKFPIIYRGQTDPDPSRVDFSKIPEGPAFDYAVRTGLQKSYTSFTPVSHATLGLKAYTQATSPIRRYLDLCNQRQMLHFIRSGKPLYSVQQLQKLVRQVEEPLRLATNVTRESKRFWILKYVEQELANIQSLDGVVVRCDHANPMVELEKIYIPAIAHTNKRVKLGQALKLKIEKIDPRYDVLRLVDSN